jgi:Zinc-binding dehydrogenase
MRASSAAARLSPRSIRRCTCRAACTWASSPAPFTFGNPDYPLSDVPLQQMVDRAADSTYKARPARVFRFEAIQDAHRPMESNQANGKIVVRL